MEFLIATHRESDITAQARECVCDGSVCDAKLGAAIVDQRKKELLGQNLIHTMHFGNCGLQEV